MKSTLIVWDFENIKGKNKTDIAHQISLIDSEQSVDTTHIGFMGDFTRHGTNTSAFESKLKALGMKVIKKNPKKCENQDGKSYLEVDMDAEIVTCLLTTGLDFDNIVLVSGDGDMLSALTALEAKGKNITVFSIRGRLSGKLKVFKTRYLTGGLNGRNNKGARRDSTS